MFTKRIIPCLDVHAGRVVKGVNFVNLRDAGDPVEIAAAYDAAGADELVFLDITASSDNRGTVIDMVRKVAICGGSGADFMSQFYGKADAYLTGDTKYRHAKNAVDHHMLLVDIHHHAENIMVRKLKELLEKEVNVEIIEGSSPDYYHYR